MAVAALIALAGFLRRRRSHQKTTDAPAVLLARDNGDDDHVERGLEQNPNFFPPAPAPIARPVQSSTEHPPTSTVAFLAVSDRDEEPPAYQDVASSHRHTPAEADVNDGGGIKPRSAPAPRDGGADEEDAAGGVTKKSSETATVIPTVSTANMSTAEQEEVAQFRQSQRAADAVAGGATKEALGASSSASQQNSGGDIGLGQAVLAAAQELARSCQIPGVSEAAGVLCIMANLFTDSRGNDQASKSRLRQCRSIVLALKRADKVVAKVSRKRAGV